MKRHDEPADILLSLSDFARICKQSKTKIIQSALLCGLAAMLFALTRPLQYNVEGTFKEKPRAESTSSGISTLLLLGGEKENPTIAMIKSRKVIGHAIKQLNLQATIEPEENRGFILRQLGNFGKQVQQTLRVEYAYLNRSVYPAIEEQPKQITVQALIYNEEIPLLLHVEVTSPTSYTIRDRSQTIGEGFFGEPFITKTFQFTLNSTPQGTSADLTGKRYTLNLRPLEAISKGIAKNLKIIADYNASSFLTLKLSHSSRQEASALLNGIMEAYRNYLISENHKVVAEQIAYLKTRQAEINLDLSLLMETHAQQVSTHAGNLDLLISTQQNLQRRLLGIDLEIKQLQKSIDEGSYLQGHSLGDSHAPTIYNALSEIQRYKQQCDTLDLLLRHNHRNHMVQQEILEQHLSDLDEIHVHAAEAQDLLIALDENKPLPVDTDLYHSPKYLVKNWQEKISTEKQHTHNFRDYLYNLLHLFEVQKKTIEDRLTHQQGNNKEFAGIDLDTANHLYISYNRELQELESTALQHQMLLEKLKTPTFELSALATILNDSVSRDIIAKASATSLTLQDQTNRTTRELERLTQELELQKTFLGNHLFEAKALLHLKIELLKDKIEAVQAATLELTQERISIQEKQLLDHGIAHIDTLAQERAVILHQKQALQDEFDKIPEQWAREKIVDLYLQTQGSLMQQIGNLIESKNIADNIDITLSTPFDQAEPPLHPNAPHIVIFALLGGLIGALGALIRNLIKSIVNGIAATAENLRLAQQHVSGTLNMPLLDRDLDARWLHAQDALGADLRETLRRLALFLLPDGAKTSPPGKTVLLLEGKGPAYAGLLGELLFKRGLKILLLPICGPHAKDSDMDLDKSLWHYLTQAESPLPRPQKGKFCDLLPLHLHEDLDMEWLHSSRYQRILNHFKETYDLVIVSSDELPCSAKGETLSSLFDHTIITVQDEKLQQLKPYFSKGENRNSFIIADAL